MARRTQSILDPDFQPWLTVAVIGAFILLAALVTLFVQLFVSVRDREQNRVPVGDPWDARGLEWSIPAPPPAYNFATIPTVHRLDAFYWFKARGEAYTPAATYTDIVVPRNSWVGPIIGGAGAVCAFGLVWHIGWMSLLGFALAWLAVIARSFVRDTHRTIPATEVKAAEDRWLALAARTRPVPRRLEESSANLGLAEPYPAEVAA